MSSVETAKVIASIFALAAFAVALIAGLAVQNSPLKVLGTAVLAMVLCHLIGLAVGAVGERVVNEHVSKVRAAEPIPDVKGKGAPVAETAGARKG